MEKKRCERCIMPEEYPGISFDDDGVCCHCTQWERDTPAHETQPLGRDRLLERIRSSKQTSDFDCVVPLSGGKDSTYVLYYAVRELNLRPIAVTYSSGFQTQVAMDNINNACDTLDVPCVIVEANKRIQDRLLKESLRMSEIAGSFVRTCLNCSTLIKAIPIKVAKQKHIPFILWGDSARESVRLVKMRSKLGHTRYEDIRSMRLFTSVAEMAARLKEIKMTPWKLARLSPKLIRYRLLSSYQLLLLGLPLKHVVFPGREPVLPKRGLQIVHFFDYVDWDPVKDLALLKEELGWNHPPDRMTRFDCSLYCFSNHGGFQADGISADGVIACNLIREGLLSREEALEAECRREQDVMEECRCLVADRGFQDFVVPSLRHGRAAHKG